MGKQPLHTAIRFWRDPDLPGVEVRFSSYRREIFRKHSHEAYSIGLIMSGRTIFQLEGATHEATAGRIALIEPGAMHACNPDQGSGMSYRMFYVSPGWLEDVARELLGFGAGAPRFAAPVLDDAPLFEAWNALYRAMRQGAGRLEKETRLLDALAGLVTRHARLGEARGSVRGMAEPDGAVGRAREHLLAHLTEPVSLEELASVAGLSRCHLARTFQEAVGLPPHAYQNQSRVELGKRLLRQGMAICQVAAETGFADQSHFTRVFRQFTGATPLQYQAAQGEPGASD